MKSSITKHQKNVATFIHLSVFTKYLFPLGNIIAPLVLWVLNKERSNYIDYNGKQALNFQISLMIYNIFLVITGMSLMIFNLDYSWDFFEVSIEHNYLFWDNLNFLDHNIFLMVVFVAIFIGLWVLELVSIIRATLQTREAGYYHYPITINFIK